MSGGDRAEARLRIEQVLTSEALAIVYQPVVDVRRGVTVGVEALARFTAEPRRTPDVWFAEAWSVGVGLELELLAIELALEALPQLPQDVYVAVNTDPRTIMSPELARIIIASNAGSRIVLEITEHAAVEDYTLLNEALAPLRAIGVRLAIDDTGAGFASLQHVLRLRPEVIKLDRSLTTHVDDNPVRGALAAALVTFGATLNAMVCAEGVETEAQLTALRDVGVATAQGYFLARPGPLPLPTLPPIGAAAERSLVPVEEDPFLRVTRLAKRALGVDIAVVSLVDDLPVDPLLRDLVTTKQPLVLDDARTRADLGAYLGVPLVVEGRVVGSLCAISRVPRAWTPSELETMADLAAMIVDGLKLRRQILLHEEREETERRFFFEQVPTASAHYELDGRIRAANRRFTAALGYADRSLDGTSGSLLNVADEVGPLWELHRSLLAGEVAEVRRPVKMIRGDGTIVVMNVRWVIVRNAKGAASHALVTLFPGT